MRTCSRIWRSEYRKRARGDASFWMFVCSLIEIALVTPVVSVICMEFLDTHEMTPLNVRTSSADEREYTPMSIAGAVMAIFKTMNDASATVEAIAYSCTAIGFAKFCGMAHDIVPLVNER